jgi:RNA polymerase sigma-70 factor, ECF subfamily
MALALPDEAQLVQQAVDDPAAFAVIYDHYFSSVYNYIRYRVEDAPTADDLTATVFEKVLHNLHRFRAEKAPFGAWLFSIARNTVTDHRRRYKQRKTVSIDRIRERVSDNLPPETFVIEKDRQQQLLDAVQQLPERERDIISLKFGAGLTNRHIADISNLSESNVGVIIYRAIRKLKTQLEAD